MPKTAEPTHVVADADVLVADLLIDGTAREAMDIVRGHDWFELFASDALLTEAATVITRLADAQLAEEWRTVIELSCQLVEHPTGELAPLASAYAADAAHLLTYDDRLTGADAGLAMRKAMPLSIRTPDAFVATVDPRSLYEATFEGDYPGPDRDPRA